MELQEGLHAAILVLIGVVAGYNEALRKRLRRLERKIDTLKEKIDAA